jgi:hypothetical protein
MLSSPHVVKSKVVSYGIEGCRQWENIQPPPKYLLKRCVDLEIYLHKHHIYDIKLNLGARSLLHVECQISNKRIIVLRHVI